MKFKVTKGKFWLHVKSFDNNKIQFCFNGRIRLAFYIGFALRYIDNGIFYLELETPIFCFWISIILHGGNNDIRRT